MTAESRAPQPASPTTARRLRREAWGFAIGSLCFLAGALPVYASWAGLVWTSITFFVGSIFFTSAALIQLALSGRRPPREHTNAADRADWWSAAIQFAGTLLFNASTFAALLAAIARPDAVGVGWRPDAWGSIAFLVSSSLAIVATRDRERLWDRDARTWHGTGLNFTGSVAFGISAVAAYVVPATGDLVSEQWTNLGTAIGALCFFTAAVLSRRTIHHGDIVRRLRR
ncbi:YrhK family protein [Microbacterium sp. CFBP9034]|uniref:YrhK family protein n=1 Tax=Microbacterium sp. CFBP9034 TaxID=3096540 RepID=UPI002A6AB68D|nr:YrhK family protein [Microbacterium sp. CFBP9034]MDY0909223.1 YrhK family protein [Microbacterium sp. CFBP9034]